VDKKSATIRGSPGAATDKRHRQVYVYAPAGVVSLCVMRAVRVSGVARRATTALRCD